MFYTIYTSRSMLGKFRNIDLKNNKKVHQSINNL